MIPIELFVATDDDLQGYGGLSTNLYRALLRAGADARLIPAQRGVGRIMPPAKLAGDPRDRDVVRVAINVAPAWMWDSARWRVGLSMWETSKLPEGVTLTPGGGILRHRQARRRRTTITPGEPIVIAWRDYADAADLVIVPCEHNRALFEQENIITPVRVMPLGIDPETWRPLERPQRQTYTFLMHGELTLRKGFELAYEAFWKAFGPNPKVHMIFKTRGMTLYNNFQVKGANSPQRFTDPNVKLVRGDWRLKSLVELMRMADCYVYPSRGEGWGLTPREAAATGLPCIVPRHTGFDRPDLDQWAFPLEHIRLEHAQYHVWLNCGDFYLPDVDELAMAMRWCYEHREWAAEFGQAASRHVRAQTWDESAKVLVGHLCERFGFDRRDLVGKDPHPQPLPLEGEGRRRAA